MKAKRVSKNPVATTTGEYRILVCGSRDWAFGEQEEIIYRHLTSAMAESEVDTDDILIITGSTEEEDNGVDSLVDSICRKRIGVACVIFRAPWENFRRRFGNPRAAGPTRNGWMLRWGRPDLVLAFHPYIVKSKGTKNMVEQARKQGVAVRVVTGKEK